MAQVEVVMPKMGESIMEGTVIEWHKQVGDEVEQDETLLEIATDKVDSEIPSPEAGYLSEILVEAGETVEVGTPIAYLVETEEELAQVGAGGGDESAAEPTPEEDVEETETASAEAAADGEPADGEEGVGEVGGEPVEAATGDEAPSGGREAASGGDGEGERVDLRMPEMGESIVEGTVLEWFKKPGDPVEEDETVLEIGTDKVDTEIPSPTAGTLVEIVAEEGETVEVGDRLAVIATGEAVTLEGGGAGAPAARGTEAVGDEGGTEASSGGESSGEPSQKAAGEPAPAGEAIEGAPSGDGIPRRSPEGRFFSPLVRSIAEKEGLTVRELESIEGSGSGGRVTKEDVMAYLEARADRPEAREREAPAVPPREYVEGETELAEEDEGYGERVEVISMDRMRQVIAEHMVHSKQTSAHVTSFAEADVTDLVRLRERNKDAFYQREGVRLSYTAFFVRAAVEALKDHPWLNASVEGDKILVKKDYHMGIAVAVEKAGLLVPVVRNAGQKNLLGLTHDIADLAERARNKELKPDELQGGTFTVTNIGSLGSMMGTPVINQPQVGILGPGAIKKRPVVIEHPERGDSIGIRHMMYISLSYDHRIIDGAMGASFLQSVVHYLENVDPDRQL